MFKAGPVLAIFKAHANLCFGAIYWGIWGVWNTLQQKRGLGVFPRENFVKLGTLNAL